MAIYNEYSIQLRNLSNKIVTCGHKSAISKLDRMCAIWFLHCIETYSTHSDKINQGSFTSVLCALICQSVPSTLITNRFTADTPSASGNSQQQIDESVSQ